MLKFAKIAVLFILFLNLIGCSNVPEGVSKSEFKEAEKVVNIVDIHFNQMEELNQENKQYIDNYFTKINAEEVYLKNEDFHLSLNKLHTSYTIALSFKGLNDESYEEFIEHYNSYKNILTENYNITFENTDN